MAEIAEIVPMNDIYDVCDIVEVSFFNVPIIIGCILAGVALIAAGVYWYKHKKGLPLQKRVSFWEHAEQQLTLLDDVSLETREDHKYFYLVLTRTLKNYLQERYTLNEGNTDQELLSALKKKDISPDALKYLHDITHHAFMVKFAHREGLHDHMRQDKAHAREILLITKPVPEKIVTKIPENS